MSRFDKYDPVSGGFRAPLNALIAAADIGKMYAVALNNTGKVIRTGISTTPVVGVIIAVRAMAAGEIIDVMTSGEIVEATTTGAVAFTAGALVYGHADGTVDATATTGKLLGQTVELDRVVVRVGAPAAVA